VNSVHVGIVIDGVRCGAYGQPASIVASTTDIVDSPCNRNHGSHNQIGIAQGRSDAESLDEVFGFGLWKKCQRSQNDNNIARHAKSKSDRGLHCVGVELLKVDGDGYREDRLLLAYGHDEALYILAASSSSSSSSHGADGG
jgi:hypothetical protein